MKYFVDQEDILLNKKLTKWEVKGEAQFNTKQSRLIAKIASPIEKSSKKKK